MMSIQLLFFFSALGAFNGFLLSGYLFFLKKQRAVQEYLLGLLTFVFCIRVGVSCYNYFDGVTPWVIIQIGLTAQFLIGPVLYSYVRFQLDSQKKSTIRVIWHVILSGVGILTFGWFYPFDTHPDIWDHKVRYVIHGWLTIYLLLAASHLFQYQLTISNKMSRSFKKAFFAFVFSVLICLGFVISLYTDYVIGPVNASILFYIIMFFIVRSYLEEKKVSHAQKSLLMSDDEAARLISSIKVLMTEQGLFKNVNLKLVDISLKLKKPSHVISYVLNNYEGKSFSTFINEYRITESKRLLLLRDQHTVEAIGYESGFSSKSSFYATFKKYTGLTPMQYKNIEQKTAQ